MLYTNMKYDQTGKLWCTQLSTFTFDGANAITIKEQGLPISSTTFQKVGYDDS